MASTSLKSVLIFALLLSVNLPLNAMLNLGAILDSISESIKQADKELEEIASFFASRGYDEAQFESALDQIQEPILGEDAPIENKILQLLRLSKQYNQPILEVLCLFILGRFKENIEKISDAFMNNSLDNNNLEINTPGLSGRTVLMHMASLDSPVIDESTLTKCCKKMILAGADIFLADENGQTCLHFAAMRHSVPLCGIFLTQPYSVDKNGNTPLHLAIGEVGGPADPSPQNNDKRLQTVKFIIDNYSNSIVNRKNISFWSPLHMACYFGHDDLVIHLLNRGAYINEQIRGSGKTALIIACEKGLENICRILLLDTSLDVTLRDKTVGNALDWASEFEHTNISELLLTSRFKKQLKSTKRVI